MPISILIAHYNNWNYFQECYQSIINQTYGDYEIIIVDDCSTDGSYEKLVDLSKQNDKIKLFQNSENKKVGFTKRRCAEEASNEICCFLDPDDKIAENALREIMETYNKANPNIVATYSRIKLINSNSKHIRNFKPTRKIKNNRKTFFNINFEVAHFFTFKKRIYDQTEGINPLLTSSVDQDLYMKLYEKGEFYFIDSFQYLYRLHDKGVSQDKSKKKKLNQNWNQVLLDACNRRGLKKLYGRKTNEINNLSRFIFKNENTLFKKICRKFL